MTTINVLDKGFVRFLDRMGDDTDIVKAARVSFGHFDDDVTKIRYLIRYLMRNEHTSPFEQVEIKFHLKMPILVARQFLRYRTFNINEISGRYTVFEEGEFYLPDPDDVCAQSEDNKQGRGEPMSEEFTVHWLQEVEDIYDSTYKQYVDSTNKGLAKELARITLPLSTYTQFYAKMDSHNLMRFLRQRLHEHAQLEIRVYAQAIAQFLKEWLPVTWEAFEDYQLYAYNLSRMEKELVRDIFKGRDRMELRQILKSKGCSDREIKHFMATFVNE